MASINKNILRLQGFNPEYMFVTRITRADVIVSQPVRLEYDLWLVVKSGFVRIALACCQKRFCPDCVGYCHSRHSSLFLQRPWMWQVIGSLGYLGSCWNGNYCAIQKLSKLLLCQYACAENGTVSFPFNLATMDDTANRK